MSRAGRLQRITIDTDNVQPVTRDGVVADLPKSLPTPKTSNTHPSTTGGENGSIYFVGTATTVIEWKGMRIMTDPNFLHAGNHVHLGPGVWSQRKTNPAVDLHNLPNIDIVLLSHYHADHFDQHVEESLRRDIPIISTPEARSILGSGEDPFTNLYDLDARRRLIVNLKCDLPGPEKPGMVIVATPAKHVPESRPVQMLNDFIGAIPPTNGYVIELGYGDNPITFKTCYRIYITGDTLMHQELKYVPRHYGADVDLMLAHLGGTTVPGPWMNPFTVMLTMDGKQGTELVKEVRPKLTIPIHYDDYDVFASPLEDFKAEIEKAGLDGRVVYLDRGDEYRFKVRDIEDAFVVDAGVYSNRPPEGPAS